MPRLESLPTMEVKSAIPSTERVPLIEVLPSVSIVTPSPPYPPATVAPAVHPREASVAAPLVLRVVNEPSAGVTPPTTPSSAPPVMVGLV